MKINMDKFEILRADVADEKVLCSIFLNHISAHKEYISHGEIQMGVGTGHFEDGKFVTDLSENAHESWMKYIHGNISDEDGAAVYKAVSEDGTIVGFCVAEIMEDGADPFGMICDVLVLEQFQGSGVGSALLEKAVSWLRLKGIRDIYLESGLRNHAAHEYFIRRGFCKISEIYKLV